MAELWLRPWALLNTDRQHRRALTNEDVDISIGQRAALWLYEPKREGVQVNGRRDATEAVVGFALESDARRLTLMPIPLRTKPGFVLSTGGRNIRVVWPGLPERPPANLEPQTDEEMEAQRLMLRVRAVWARLKDVDVALADPAKLWPEIRRRWMEKGGDDKPEMDVIVRHTFHLRRIIDQLGRMPRRTLRRTHQQVPISRVQEMDRRAIRWLVRQPGETLAERAGNLQRVLAVAREDNLDTLENRVLRAYCELAAHVAREYLDLNRRKRHTTRARKVEDFGRSCRRLARDLAERGVRVAEPGVTPNFVLQQNANYHQVWKSWLELLDRDRVLDELWRWQARSWEEFCVVAVMVALIGLPGVKLIATAPIDFLQEQRRGCWITHDNPLADVYLPEQRFVVELRYRMQRPGSRRSDFAAPIWLRFGRTGDVSGFSAYVAVWPIWDVRGGTISGEIEELEEVLKRGLRSNIVAGLVLRPTPFEGNSETQTSYRGRVVTIGTEGPALWDGLKALTDFLTAIMIRDNHQ